MVLVDDNPCFMRSLSLSVPAASTCLQFTMPYKALQYLKEEYQASTAAFSHQGNNCKAIIEQLQQPRRFDDISLVIVDYAMPGLNGLDLCAQLINSPYKKILLTGKAEQALAVEAFNNGLIDGYIRKDDPQFLDNFNEMVRRLQHLYFKTLSTPMLSNLQQTTDCALNLATYQKLYQHYYEQYNIKESYLIDTTGSLLMLDDQSLPHWLITRSGSQMQAYTDLAMSHDASTFVSDSLNEREFLPFFGLNFQVDQVAMEEWDLNLFACQTLVDYPEDFYVAFISLLFEESLPNFAAPLQKIS
jgi:CheY-like chemotaxis protein